MKRKTLFYAIAILASLTVFLFEACAPLREFGKSPAFPGENNFRYEPLVYDSSKKTVVVLANNDGTELFDMMAPYYLFNTTGKANVYILADNKFPVVVKKGVYILPQATFHEIDSLGIKADVIIIPFLSVADSQHQDPSILSWIRHHYSPEVTVLSICDGSATAAATGLFDGKPLTAHASDYESIKSNFSKPVWVKNTSVAVSGNLFSTAGVSNAVEGSLFVINKLFGAETMRKVMEDISYPYPSPKLEHRSNTFHLADKVVVGQKLILRKSETIGVMLQDGINEFELAGVMDTYNRTFPGSIESYSVNNRAIRSGFGLTIIPTGTLGAKKVHELHVTGVLTDSIPDSLKSAEVINYNARQKRYIFDFCLQRIGHEYGGSFQNMVKLMLDYN